MVFGLDNQWYNQTLNMKTDFEKYIICDVSITLMMADNLRKQCIGCLHFSKY